MCMKKILALFTVVLLLAALFSGCANETAKDPNSGNAGKNDGASDKDTNTDDQKGDTPDENDELFKSPGSAVKTARKISRRQKTAIMPTITR